MADFKLEEILVATGGSLVTSGALDTLVTGICTDSRKLEPGQAFLALRGENFDGHTFLAEASQKGASVLIVAQAEHLPPGVPAVLVTDTLSALGSLARYHRQRFSIPVIAITGSNGKTSTKEMTAAVIGSVWRTVKTEKNFNNEVGLPMTLLGMDQSTQACVVEMGMRGPGQIRSLAAIAQPTIGIITNVGVTHMELLGSQAAIAQAKGELAEALPDDGILVLNGDDPWVTAMDRRSRARAYRFSLEKPTDLYLVEREPKNDGQQLVVDGAWGRFSLFLPAYGRYNAANALAAALAGLALGISPEKVAEGLARLTMVEGRLRLKTAPSGLRILDDTYNSSPPAVEAALEAMDGLDGNGRRIAVLGDMLELGEIAHQAHAEVGRMLARHRVDQLYAFGPLSREMAAAAGELGLASRHYLEMEALLADLLPEVAPEDLILVKGSRGMRMERVVQALLGRDEA
ncbi:MAG TPA: UDP-N-acetylmuramoyl-tripeptide--D-alanyl-D-alanine ligase [Firmicutes bacterium]|jgi:UDP-N-acetylmuramoyl-tripeptide--D-alanyl-D-alanine ligase|nr:UDP-N-acetylmuramoyl-tripeptide--D-alanyl-D-alanine ligase [Bacillota bacterium]